MYVSYRLIFFSIHSPHFYQQTGSLDLPYSIDGQSKHLSIDQVPSTPHTTSIHHPLPILLLTSLHPRFEDCRLVEWALIWHTRISTMCFRHGQTSTSTKNPSIRVPICAVLMILIFIMTSHPLPLSSTRVRWQYQIRYTLFNWPCIEVSYPSGGH